MARMPVRLRRRYEAQGRDAEEMLNLAHRLETGEGQPLLRELIDWESEGMSEKKIKEEPKEEQEPVAVVSLRGQEPTEEEPKEEMGQEENDDIVTCTWDRKKKPKRL